MSHTTYRQEAREYLDDALAIEAPPHDTLARSLWRVDFLADAMYDRSPDPDEAGQPIRDLLTDLRHWCDANDVDLYREMDGSYQMYLQEKAEWEERRNA